MKSLKRSSGISDNTKAGNSFIHKSNNSDFSNSSKDFETVKKITRKPSIQLEELSFRERSHTDTFRDILPSTPTNNLHSFEHTFHCIPEIVSEDTLRDEGAKVNDWTKTFKNLMSNGEDKLNVSISDGQDIKNTYLSDVKL